MTVAIERVVPIILVFFLGFALKSVGVFTRNDGNTLVKVFFNVSVPALIFMSVAKMNFTLQLLWLPLIAALVILANYAVAHCCGRQFNLDRSSFGVFLVGSLIMNTGFTFPFIFAASGEEGLAQAALFDFGNTALIFTFVYYLACRYGANTDNGMGMLKKFLSSPPLLALILGLLMNLFHLRVPSFAGQALNTVGYMAIPMVMLTLGIFFSPKAYKLVPVFSAVFIRVAVGLLFGAIFVKLFRLEGVSRAVVLVCSSAPSGLTTLVFSSMEGLDNEFAAGVVSYSVIVSIFLIPFLLQVYSC